MVGGQRANAGAFLNAEGTKVTQRTQKNTEKYLIYGKFGRCQRDMVIVCYINSLLSGKNPNSDNDLRVIFESDDFKARFS
jgi:hypothetical protein